MADTYKIEDGHKYRLVSLPAHPVLIAYWTRAGYGGLHNEHDNPEQIWEPFDD